jgi:hypothetical protein
MQKLKQILVDRDGYTHKEAIQEIKQMMQRVREGESPEEILYEIGLEPDYVFELL